MPEPEPFRSVEPDAAESAQCALAFEPVAAVEPFCAIEPAAEPVLAVSRTAVAAAAASRAALAADGFFRWRSVTNRGGTGRCREPDG
ncbi:MAG: hypothetical protein EA417_08845 [Gammaproteobacteria bacterium]|nr:MAG: hypothetical protein EA417_08845 [Gammaproteobacteria bacterium]